MDKSDSRATGQPRNPLFSEILDVRLSRRQLLAGGLAAAVSAVLPGCAAGPASRGAPPAGAPLGFAPIAPSAADALRVPEGHATDVLYRWGDPVGSYAGLPAFKMDASNSAAEQALQAGMHHDGMNFYPLPYSAEWSAGSSARGLLAMNHEYLDQNILFADGMKTWSAEKVKKAQAAVGVSIIEIEFRGGRWDVVRPSVYARRITASTPCRISGPAAGDEFMRTALDPSGREVLGTYNGCAMGYTPWGTYLTCEENWNEQFVNGGERTSGQKRYGIRTSTRYRWEEHDQRFDAVKHPNEPNRFGWVVEIDPYTPDAKPVKRTAMGRLKHEGAAVSVAPDLRLAFYMGDDEAFEYIYKFVTETPYNPDLREANRDLLDAGTLYVAKFNSDGSGQWLALVHGENGLTEGKGFRDQAEVLIRTRQSADAAGGTPMDRPEWCAVHPHTREVYCTLTNNSARGASFKPGIDAANPRANNRFGHIIRWREEGGDPAATRFSWDIFAMGGDPANAEPAKQGRFKGDAFGSPDGLYFDTRGVLWVETDISPTALNAGDFTRLGNNQMLAVDPVTGEFKRFLTGPAGCEITGLTGTPDGKTFFVNIQHPGEGPKPNTPENPRAYSNWPDYAANGRPRSATVVIRKKDGGVIGT